MFLTLLPNLTSGISYLFCKFSKPPMNTTIQISCLVVVVIYFILSRLLYLAFSANFGSTMHAASRHGTPSLASLPKDGGVSCFGRLSGRSPIQFLTVHSHA